MENSTNINFAEIFKNKIIDVVMEYYGVDREKFFSKCRLQYIIEARQTCMYLLRKFTRLTLLETGREFGMINHTTVWHAENIAVPNRMIIDPIYRKGIEYMTRIIANERKNIDKNIMEKK